MFTPIAPIAAGAGRSPRAAAVPPVTETETATTTGAGRTSRPALR
ncbi:hypothetical protein [Streptomyces sp. NPDC050388]